MNCSAEAGGYCFFVSDSVRGPPVRVSFACDRHRTRTDTAHRPAASIAAPLQASS